MQVPITQQYALGIDIGGTNTVLGLVDPRGFIQYRGAFSTKTHETVETFIETLFEHTNPAI